MKLLSLMIVVGASSAFAVEGDSAPDAEGIAANYPGDVGIAKHPDVIYATGFEKGIEAPLKKKRKGVALLKDPKIARTGKFCASITATRNKDTGGDLDLLWRDGVEQCFVRVYLKFHKDTAMPHHFVNLRGHTPTYKYRWGGAAGMRPPGGVDGAFGTTLEPPKLDKPNSGWHFYSYWNQMRSWQTVHGEADGRANAYYGNGFRPGGQRKFAGRGKWICVEFMVKLNTIGKSDGEQAFWIDGKKVGHWAPGTPVGTWIRDRFSTFGRWNTKPKPFTGFRWRTDASLKVNKASLQWYLSNRTWKQMTVDKNIVYFDNFVVAKKYIGPIATKASAARKKVTVIRTPDNGNQVQAAIDGEGTVHAVYLKGGKNVYYAKLAAGERKWSKSLRVNSQAGSATETGTIRGAQIAIGRNGRVHVVWNGSGSALPKGPPNPALPKDNKHRLSSPFLYSRLSDDGSSFEKQRSMLQSTYALDGGGSIAADAKGNVYVFWHAMNGGKSEAERRVWVRMSSDDGKSFGDEKRAVQKETGACGCCGMRAFVDSKGAVYALYRAATNEENRDMTLLKSSPEGAGKFESEIVHPWKLRACPMSSASMAEGPDGVVVAWETNEQVYFASASSLGNAIAPPGSGERKHPTVAVNKNGETLLAWADGTGWNRGGNLHWQLFDAKGNATKIKGKVRNGIRTWGLAAVVVRPDGTFLLIH